MNVSGTLVTGMPRAVAAATSTESTPTEPSEITRQRARPSMIFVVILRPLAYSASASRAAATKSSSPLASISTISAPSGRSASSSSAWSRLPPSAAPRGPRTEIAGRMRAWALWRRLDAPGHDACRLDDDGTGWRLHGTAVYGDNGVPVRLDYEVACSDTWVTRDGRVRGWLGARAV